VKSGVRFVTLGENEATAFPSSTSGDLLEAGSSRTYAMYVPQNEHLTISMEVCDGGGNDAKLLVCGSSSCTCDAEFLSLSLSLSLCVYI